MCEDYDHTYNIIPVVEHLLFVCTGEVEISTINEYINQSLIYIYIYEIYRTKLVHVAVERQLYLGRSFFFRVQYL